MTSPKPLRVLLTEGASTSAREVVTVLGLTGHHIEIMDPDAHCICRFSRFVSKVHRCPPLATDPKAYLAFALDLLQSGRFDVLLPIHEQGFLFAKAVQRIPHDVAVALPTFADYTAALDKRYFSAVLAEIGVPQPKTRIVSGASAIPRDGFPFIVKRPTGTASRTVHIVRTNSDAARAREMFANPAGELLVQELIDAPVEHAQTLFDRGRFVAQHGYRQILRGVGGGEALKESIYRPRVLTEMKKIGERLNWHGAISVDYLLKDGVPHFIDCNPRLVEPMSAYYSDLDLADILLRISRGEHPAEAAPSKEGVRTHLSMQALLGKAVQTGSRAEIIREIWRFCTASGPYAGSREELTPVRLDWMAILPVAFTAAAVLASPKTARILPERGWGAGLLTPDAIRIIRDDIE